MSKLQTTIRHIRWSIHQRGLLGTASVIAGRVMGRRRELPARVHPFDEEFGVETSGLIGGGALGIGHPHDRYIVAYYGVQPSRLRLALTQWQATEGTKPVADHTFVDIGCGKGRAMMIASEQCFREIMGIEMNAEMAAVALQNIATWQAAGRTQCSMVVLEGDATEIHLPDGPLLLFLYNPFHAPVLRLLLQRIESERPQGDVDLLYMVTAEAAVFEEFPRFELRWSEIFTMSASDRMADLVSTPDDRCNLYRLRPRV